MLQDLQSKEMKKKNHQFFLSQEICLPVEPVMKVSFTPVFPYQSRDGFTSRIRNYFLCSFQKFKNILHASKILTFESFVKELVS